MIRYAAKVLFCALVVFFLLAVEPILAQQSTTGPVPPPDIDRGIRRTTATQVVIPEVPAYLWQHGCGPTAVGMVIGYWDRHGFDLLVSGDASTQTASVNAMISDDGGIPDCVLPDGNHYQDYSCPEDYWPNPISADRSQLGGAHASNCVADFFQTSWSSRDNYYGWSWFSDVPGSFTSYVNLIAPQYNPSATNKYYAQFSWSDYKAVIDAGRPVVLLVDTDGNGSTDHFIPAIGYNEATKAYGAYNTWDLNLHWYLWRRMQSGNTWGIYGVTLFEIGTIPNSFSLLFPLNYDSLKTPVVFNWESSIDPDPNDTIRYDLYLSRSAVFNPDSTIIIDSLSDTSYTRDSLDTKNWYWKVKAYDQLGVTRLSNQTWSFYVYKCGDSNVDGKVTVSDIVYDINYLFKGGSPSAPFKAGDATCDSKVTVADVIFKISYLFKGGPPPCHQCP